MPIAFFKFTYRNGVTNVTSVTRLVESTKKQAFTPVSISFAA